MSGAGTGTCIGKSGPGGKCANAAKIRQSCEVEGLSPPRQRSFANKIDKEDSKKEVGERPVRPLPPSGQI